MLALRLHLADSGKLSFPAFDTVFKRYFDLTQTGRNLASAHPELFRQPNDILQFVADFTESVSGVPLVGAVVKLGNKADQLLYMQRWMKRRGAALLQGLDSWAPHELESRLPIFFGAYIDDWLQESAGRRVVVLYDTYEGLWRDRPNHTDTLVDNWVRHLVEETPAVLHVILGRDPLAWAEHEPQKWQGIITRFPLDQLLDTDAETFLQAAPIVEADIRAQIIQGAKGIPFYLNLQVDQYEDSKRSGKPPQAEEYGGAEPQMLERFRNHLPDSLHRALVVAACPRWLDEVLFLKLCDQFLGGAAAVRFAELSRYSFWTKSAERYYLHAVMRDYLQADSRTREAALYGQMHQYLFEHYAAKLDSLESARDLTNEHAEALGEGAYHLELLRRAQLPRWVDKFATIFHTAAQWNALEPLLQLSLVIYQEIGDKSGEGTTLNNISQIYDARGDYASALVYLEKSLEIQQAIGNKSGEGATLNNISLIFQARGDYASALAYLEQSLEIRQAIGDKSGEGTTLNNISQIYDARGDYASALTYLEKSLEICQAIGNKSGEGTTLNNISQIYDARGDYASALSYLEKSLEIRQAIGDKAGLCVTLLNMGHIHWQNEQADEAKRLWVEVYRIAKQLDLAQALGALENLAGGVGLSGGLSGWDALAQQMEQEAVRSDLKL